MAGLIATGLLLGAFALVAIVLLDEARSEPIAGALSSEWSPNRGRFGLTPLVLGTVVSSGLGLALAAPLAILGAVWVVDLAPHRLRRRALPVIQIVAAVPSVVFGLWGRSVVVPSVRGGLAAIGVDAAHGYGLLASGLVLAAMALPTIMSLSCAVLCAIPASLRETAIALGASRWEAVRHVVIPAARTGIAGAVAVGLSRALGESVAVELVCGSSPVMPSPRLGQASTLGAILVDEYAEAIGARHLGALAQCALVLGVLAVLVDWMGRRLAARVSDRYEPSGRGRPAASGGAEGGWA